MRITLIALALFVIGLGVTYYLLRAPHDAAGWVVTSPDTAEIVVAVAGTDSIIAIADECDWPPALKEKPRVGSFGQVNLEKLAELHPSLVLTAAPAQDALTERLHALNYRAESLSLRSADDLLAAVLRVGELTNHTERAAAVADSLSAAFAAARTDSILATRVYVDVSAGFWTVSGRSLLGEVVRLAGGRNLYEDASWEYAQVSQADVVAADPDVILLTYPGVTAADVAARKGWERVSAVRNGRIYTATDVNPDLIVRCGPRLPQGVARLRELFAMGVGETP